MQDRLFLGDLVESQTATINIIQKENRENRAEGGRGGMGGVIVAFGVPGVKRTSSAKGWSLKSKNIKELCSCPGGSEAQH